MNVRITIRRVPLLIIACLGVLCSAAHTQSIFRNKDAWYIELGGKGIVYALTVEHLYDDRFGLSAGIMVAPGYLGYPADDPTFNYREVGDGWYFKAGPLIQFGTGGPRSLSIRSLLWFGIGVGKTF
jgi:hypothetical protein